MRNDRIDPIDRIMIIETLFVKYEENMTSPIINRYINNKPIDTPRTSGLTTDLNSPLKIPRTPETRRSRPITNNRLKDLG